MKIPKMSEATRGWIYRVLLSLQPLIVLYGRSQVEVALWMGVASAVLSTGLATLNTTTSQTSS